MRAMSFSLTTQQILDESKTVTRRTGWLTLKVGDRLRAVEKCMGLKKGEKQRVLKIIEVVAVRREPLYAITAAEVSREGFHGMGKFWFQSMFCRANGCDNHTIITRIEFKYVRE